MNTGPIARLGALCRADFFSSRDFIRHAALIAVLYGVVHLAGLREFTSVLNGTMGSVSLGWQASSVLGVAYILLYLAFVVLVPILILAAALIAVWEKFRRVNKRHQQIDAE